MNPSHAAARNRQLSLELAEAARRADVLEMQRILSELTALMHMQFGYADTRQKPSFLRGAVTSRIILQYGKSRSFTKSTDDVGLCSPGLTASGVKRLLPLGAKHP